MISFATEFPLRSDRGAEEFLRTVEAWLLGSPHTLLKLDDLAGLHDGTPLFSVHKRTERLDRLQVRGTDAEALGLRYTRLDDDLEWVTTAVFSGTHHDSWVRIQVQCESRQPAARLPPAKKPILVQKLLEQLGGASDGTLPVSTRPRNLDHTEIGFAARLILGDSWCRLPIVYVSADSRGHHIVDCDRLAFALAGMAHVVVEPNRPFSLRLKLEVASANVYGGAVGVYWPEGGGRRSFFLGRQFDSAEEVERAVVDEVRQALTNRQALLRCTWASIQEAASRQTILELRASGSQEIEKYIETFDQELSAKNQQIADAEREVTRLRTELRIYEARLATSSGALLNDGPEQDLFPNEVFNIVRDAVESAQSQVSRDSRRQHVLTGILEANPLREDIAEEKREALKNCLRGTSTVDAKVRRGLEDIGFDISPDGKHFKIVFQGDDRYTFTLAKSGSDHRGGLNAASDIGRLLF